MAGSNVIGIPEFYSGRHVFVTGATGFMGKVLVEKLLRSCPDIGNVYMLMRPKRGKDLASRLQDMTNIPLFDRLKNEQPGAIEKKMIPVLGDVIELGLGLSAENRRLLEEKVSVVFHVAASVRFDDPLKYAILLNTRGTREVANLALNMKNLAVLLHVSTSYSNCDRKEVGEKIYPAPADWRKTIEIAEKCDEYVLDVLTTKYMDKMPNTYTFTKSLAEHVVHDLCRSKIPVVIYRPSIVISTMHEPIEGWIDNFNGPVGILVACGKGIMRTMHSNPNLYADYMPVDIAIKAIIVAAWEKATNAERTDWQVAFYNATSTSVRTVTMAEIVNMGIKFTKDVPLNDTLWPPGGSATTNRFKHYIRVIFCHMLPAVLVDTMLRLTGKKPILVKIHRKIFIANVALRHFITNQWKFDNDEFIALDKKIPQKDRDDFRYDFRDVDVELYFKNCIYGARQYLLKEDPASLPQARVHASRMYWIDKLVRFLFFLLAFWYIIKSDLYSYVTSKFGGFADS